MPNLKSAKQRMKLDRKRNAHNNSVKSDLRTQLKKTLSSIKAGDKQAATESLSISFSKLDKASKRGLIHKNAANRKKAQLSSLAATLS